VGDAEGQAVTTSFPFDRSAGPYGGLGGDSPPTQPYGVIPPWIVPAGSGPTFRVKYLSAPNYPPPPPPSTPPAAGAYAVTFTVYAAAGNSAPTPVANLTFPVPSAVASFTIPASTLALMAAEDELASDTIDRPTEVASPPLAVPTDPTGRPLIACTAADFMGLSVALPLVPQGFARSPGVLYLWFVAGANSQAQQGGYVFVATA